MIKFLNKAEVVLLALFAASTALELFGTKISILYTVSLAGLGLVFFLFAQFPSNSEQKGDQSSDFKKLLGLVILPKILWIATAITTVGILFHLQEFPGASKLLMIGGSTIAFTTLILLVLRFMKINGLENVIPILYRSYPALLAAAYFIFA